MIHTVLIANRGEIASRIIRTCRRMGIRTVAVFSDADQHQMFVEEADVAVHIGESSPSASYLNADRIIEAARKTGANSIHPGYGFLSENAAFARRCKAEGLVFIGPNPEAIEAMGSKSQAKSLMIQHGVPVVPGYQGEDQSRETLEAKAKEIGFPVLIKAAAGGGGKGMRIVNAPDGLRSGIEAARREASNAFGDDELIIEKYVSSGRHIEFQVFGDQYGNVIHVLERECSLQRRYQKVVEESPSPVLDEAMREKMGQAAVAAAKALNYDNAGTVEFIYDGQTGDFYFLEVNTRLQVEHPVTEAITGLDLVQMQLESAMGLPLQLTQEAVKGNGYAVEVRLYAEDPDRDFMPATGKVHRFEAPQVEGFRLETAVRSGSEISVFYDPMIAKLIVWDKTRAAAHRKMQYVLDHLVCLGTITNQAFLSRLFQLPEMLAGEYDTHFIKEKDLTEIQSASPEEGLEVCAMAACLHSWAIRENSRVLLAAMPSGWRNNFSNYQQVTYLHNDVEIPVLYRYGDSVFLFQITGKEYEASLISATEEQVCMELNGIRRTFEFATSGNSVFIHSPRYGIYSLEQKDRFPAKKSEKVQGGYEAPMPSQIVKILVTEGQEVTPGDGLVVLSSMKMENTIQAAEAGTVQDIFAKEGDNVDAGFLLLKLEAS